MLGLESVENEVVMIVEPPDVSVRMIPVVSGPPVMVFEPVGKGVPGVFDGLVTDPVPVLGKEVGIPVVEEAVVAENVEPPSESVVDVWCSTAKVRAWLSLRIVVNAASDINGARP